MGCFDDSGAIPGNNSAFLRRALLRVGGPYGCLQRNSPGISIATKKPESGASGNHSEVQNNVPKLAFPEERVSAFRAAGVYHISIKRGHFYFVNIRSNQKLTRVEYNCFNLTSEENFVDWIAIIRECFVRNAVLYTSHSRNEMLREEFGEIVEREVVEAVMAGEIIEEYPDDTPYQSVLMFGKTHANRPIHMVCAYAPDEQLVIVITVYHPDPRRWDDYRRRII